MESLVPHVFSVKSNSSRDSCYLASIKIPYSFSMLHVFSLYPANLGYREQWVGKSFLLY